MDDTNPYTDSWFQVNRVIDVRQNEALVQWVEMGVDLALRWPWQHTVVCTRTSASFVLETVGTRLRYQQVLALADDLKHREIESYDLVLLTSAPTKLYSELQGQGGWW